MLKRFNIDIKTQRIILSVIALATALLIAFLQGDDPRDAKGVADAIAPPAEASEAQQQTADARSVTPVRNRDDAVARAIRWVKAQEGGKHRGHTIARHVGKSYEDLEGRIERDNKRVESGFFDMETAAVAIVRTINHKPNKPRVQKWLMDNDSRRRLALRRFFDKPIGRIVYRGGDRRQGNTAVVVLTKWTSKGKQTYRLLTAYVEK
jgi:hypothetical protein